MQKVKELGNKIAPQRLLNWSENEVTKNIQTIPKAGVTDDSSLSFETEYLLSDFSQRIKDQKTC